MKIYLAARYSRREELCGYRSELEAIGHTVTSRWLNGKPQREPEHVHRVQAGAVRGVGEEQFWRRLRDERSGCKRAGYELECWISPRNDRYTGLVGSAASGIDLRHNACEPVAIQFAIRACAGRTITEL